MAKMNEQMSKIQQTQDPQQRQRLLNEHWSTMQNAMGTMQGMMGCCGKSQGGQMMGGPMMGGHMMMWNDGAGAAAVICEVVAVWPQRWATLLPACSIRDFGGLLSMNVDSCFGCGQTIDGETMQAKQRRVLTVVLGDKCRHVLDEGRGLCI